MAPDIWALKVIRISRMNTISAVIAKCRGMVKIANGAAETALEIVRISPVDEYISEQRVEGDGLVEVGDGPVKVTFFSVGEPAIVVSCILWIEVNGLVVVGDGAVELTFVGVSEPTVVVG